MAQKNTKVFEETVKRLLKTPPNRGKGKKERDPKAPPGDDDYAKAGKSGGKSSDG